MDTKVMKLVNEGENNNDTNFCTVISLAVAFGKTYAESNDYLRANAGRRKRKGLSRDKFEYAIKKLAGTSGYGYNVFDSNHVGTGSIRVNCHRPRSALSVQEKFGIRGKMTVNNCLRYLSPKKNYIIGVRGHAVGVAGGKVLDWTEGRRHQVQQIIELTPNESYIEPVVEPIIKKASMSLEDMISSL